MRSAPVGRLPQKGLFVLPRLLSRLTGHRWWPFFLLMLAIAVAIASYGFSTVFFKQQALVDVRDRAEFYRTMLVKTLERYQHLPLILAEDVHVIEGAEGRNLTFLNHRLARFARQSDLEAIYLMRPDGTTIATSNFDKPVTYLGENYAFRPYFQEAMKGRSGDFFAIGVTTLRPGYFVAAPVRKASNPGTVLGVIAIKVDLKPLTDAWRNGGERVFVANKDGIIILSSNEAWRYRALKKLTDTQRALIKQDRQFGREPLPALDWQPAGHGLASLAGQAFFTLNVPVPDQGWQLYFLAPEAQVKQQASLVTVIVGIVLALVLAWGLFIRSERIRAAFETSQHDRRKLRNLNLQLAQEIEERRAAEQQLAVTQAELDRASRLAALGHLSASVTHELGQPISAMQNYLAAADIDPHNEDWPTFVTRLSGIARRMEHITNQLRFFAKPDNRKLEHFDSQTLIDGALGMVKARLEAGHIQVHQDEASLPFMLKGDRMRLEQVLINLFSNACNAVQHLPNPTLTISTAIRDQQGHIVIADNGHGFATLDVRDLFEPFYTTRASGDGMGLGLAISQAIVREHDGTLTAREAEGGGAVFEIILPVRDT